MPSLTRAANQGNVSPSADSVLDQLVGFAAASKTKAHNAPGYDLRARFLLPDLIQAFLWSGTVGGFTARRFLCCGTANPPLPGHQFAVAGLVPNKGTA